jgi:hypothetical protein
MIRTLRALPALTPGFFAQNDSCPRAVIVSGEIHYGERASHRRILSAPSFSGTAERT